MPVATRNWPHGAADHGCKIVDRLRKYNVDVLNIYLFGTIYGQSNASQFRYTKNARQKAERFEGAILLQHNDLNQWLGTESNRRHADFQASNGCSFRLPLVALKLSKFHPVQDLVGRLFPVTPSRGRELP